MWHTARVAGRVFHRSTAALSDVAHSEGLSPLYRCGLLFLGFLSRSLFNAFFIELEYSAQDVKGFTLVWVLLWETLEGELFATSCNTPAAESRCEVM
jgi:hypothetical protein